MFFTDLFICLIFLLSLIIPFYFRKKTECAMNNGKKKLVVEVVGAHNLMLKDGEGSSSPFVEVEFESQRQRTQVKYRDLNPVWNEKLVFHVNDFADLPYGTIEVNVFNEGRSNDSRNFLGNVSVSGSSIAREGEEVPQLYTLEKRSLFSHVRGEITLKLYLSPGEEVKQVIKEGGLIVSSATSKKSKKLQQEATNMGDQQQLGQGNTLNLQNQSNPKLVEPSPGDIKPVVITTAPAPAIPAASGSASAGLAGGGGGHGGGVGVYPAGPGDYSMKETSPHLGGGPLNKDKTSSTYDLVEQMQYLYLRVVKAREVCVFGGGELVAEVKLGNYRGITKRKTSGGAEWDQVFAFSKDCIQSSVVDIFVKESNKDDFLGRVWFDLNEVPKRVPSDSQLAPQWYRMEDKKGEKAKGGEVMVAIWFGTQADEAFAGAWHSKAANVHPDYLCSKVYPSPKLWYLRVKVIEAQDVISGKKVSSLIRYPQHFAKVQVENQILRTRIASPMSSKSLSNPVWNEKLLFVVAEPFEDCLVSVEDRIAPNMDEVVGRVLLPITSIERRLDQKPVISKWFDLDIHCDNQNEESKAVARFASRIHLRASLDGGYHVFDEASMYSSDLRPTAEQLWKPHIGVLEVGVLGATNLVPMKGGGGATDAYCVAKYGQKWVRTRTVVDSLSPKWNEQYTWEVFDPCTVITIGVFDNARVDKNTAVAAAARDSRIGKVRIRLSTLESNRDYTHAYPLLTLHPSGLKKMGELHLAVRFSCANIANVLHMYTMPLLPKMHYVKPLSVSQLDSLRYHAMNLVVSRLGRAEPPLGREVVQYMFESPTWSLRKSKAIFFRLWEWLGAMSGLLHSLRNWHNPVSSTLFMIVFIIFAVMPELIVPSVLLTMAAVGIRRYRARPRHPYGVDIRLSGADIVHPDELDEEFDSFPTSRSAEVVRMRYDRLRTLSARIQTVVENMVNQGEKLQALLSWHDPRATFLFVMVCFIAACGLYWVPFKWVVVLGGLYLLRPPKFRNRLPSTAVNFYRRLPTRAESVL